MATIFIQEPSPAGARAPQWRAFLEMGFRPLYLAGCFWAALSVALWVYAPQWLRGLMPGLYWHAHEMLWGFVATIAVGFLLTAAGNWTGANPLQGRPLGWLALLWIVARIAYLLPGAIPFWAGAVAESAFFVMAAVALGKVIFPAPAKRNYGVPGLVGGLGLFNLLFLLAVWQGSHELLMQFFNAGLLCMAVIAILIARRVIPFFASRGIPGLEVPLLAGSGRAQLAAGGLAIAFIMLDRPAAAGIALAVAGLIALFQVMAWKPWAVLRKPILWILYVGYTALGIGLLAAAFHFLGAQSMRAVWSVHIIGVAGFSVLIIGMVTRTALGHLGRPLQTDRSMVVSYVLIILAALLRLAALAPTSYSLPFLHSAALAWVLGFGLYLWRFLPWMVRPRADGR